MEEITKKIEEVRNWVSENQVLPRLKNNNDYMEFAFELSNHIRYLMFVSASLLPQNQTNGYGKHSAVIVGLFIRVCKLYDALCYHVSENQGEIATIFSRLIFESYVKMRYLIKKGQESTNNFIFVSFQSTVDQYKDLVTKQAQRDLTPIEERILSKIEGQFDEIGIDKESLFSNKDWRLDGKSFKGLCKYLDIEASYYFIFGAQSSFVHGDWYDIRAHHLTYRNDKYQPRIDHHSVDTRYICPISILCLDALIDFLKWNHSDPDNFVISTADAMGEIVYALDNHHEQIVMSKGKIT